MAVPPSLILVGVSTACSLIFKYSARLQLNTTHRSRIIAIHAFAIEGFQIFWAIVTVVDYWNSLQSQFDHFHFRPTHLADWLAVVTIVLPANVLVLAYYFLAILAIDTIDNLVQVGTCGHPFQPQIFLLTRSVLLPQTVRRRPPVATKKEPVREARGRSRTKKTLTSSVTPRRASSQPATPLTLRDMGVELPSETRNALARANPFGERLDKVRFRARTISTPTHARTAHNATRDLSPLRIKTVRLSTQANAIVRLFNNEAKPAETTNSKSELHTPEHNTGETPSLGSEDTISSPSTDGHPFTTPMTPQSLVDEVQIREHSSVDSLGNSCILRARPRAFSTKLDGMRKGMSLDVDGSVAIRNGRARGNSVKERVQHFEQDL